MKQANTNNINLSGPNKILYFINKKFNKKIIVLGDIFGDKVGVCSDAFIPSMSITEYIDKLKTNYPIDIFLGTEIPSKYFLNNPNSKNIQIQKSAVDKTTDNISELLDYSFSNYKVNFNKRFHFTDFRKNIIGHETFRDCSPIINLVVEKRIDSWKDIVKRVIPIIISEYSKSLFAILDWVIYNDTKNLYTIPYYLKKEYEKLSNSNKDILNKMIGILKKYMQDYLDIYYTFDFYNNSDDINLLIGKLYNLGQQAGAAITDFYTISRIMKSNKYNNCIVYVGKAHCVDIQNYLEAIGFELHREINCCSQFDCRCIKNILDFKEFFESK